MTSDAAAARRRAARNRRYRKRVAQRLRVAKRLAATAEHGRAPITTYDGFVAYMVARRKALGLSQLELDDRAGFQSGYAGKLEAWRGPQGKVAGSVTMPLWMEALGVALVPMTQRPKATKRPKLGSEVAHRRRIPRGDPAKGD